MRSMFGNPNVWYREYIIQDILKDIFNISFLKEKYKVYFNELKGTTVLKENNKITKVKTTKGDEYDKKYGFLLAFFQHNCGLSKTQANKYLKELCDEV